MKLKIFMVIILFISIGFYCIAEEPEETFTLNQIRAFALLNSRILSKYNLSVESSILNERAQTYRNLPSFSLGGSAGGNLWGGDVNITDDYNAGVNISLSQKIWDGGRNSVMSSINRLSTDIARKEALQRYFMVLDSADAAYYGVLEAHAALEAANSLLDVSQLTLTIAKIRHESGVISIGDYLRAVAENESRKTNQNLARRDLLLSIARLRSITGLRGNPVLQPINFDYYEHIIQKLSELSYNEIDNMISVFLETIYMNSPLLARSALASRRADRAVSLATRNYLPNINLGISTGLTYNNIHGRENSPGRLTISGSIPLDFWVIRNNVNNTQIAHRQAILDHMETELALDIEIQSGILNCIAQASSVISSRKAWEYAKKQLENTMELYRLASASTSELSDAIALVSSNKNHLIRARYSFLMSLSVIRSLGTFDSEQAVLALMLSSIDM
ncbi:MAG: TolC family protein [Spirochaetaceae bacterium]|nr:TolC family protein [Spirochaetaceae bacterium]